MVLCDELMVFWGEILLGCVVMEVRHACRKDTEQRNGKYSGKVNHYDTKGRHMAPGRIVPNVTSSPAKPKSTVLRILLDAERRVRGK
jgi:hypothetical protein